MDFICRFIMESATVYRAACKFASVMKTTAGWRIKLPSQDRFFILVRPLSGVSEKIFERKIAANRNLRLNENKKHCLKWILRKVLESCQFRPYQILKKFSVNIWYCHYLTNFLFSFFSKPFISQFSIFLL